MSRIDDLIAQAKASPQRAEIVRRIRGMVYAYWSGGDRMCRRAADDGDLAAAVIADRMLQISDLLSGDARAIEEDEG